MAVEGRRQDSTSFRRTAVSDFFAGWLSYAIALAVNHPIDTLRTRQIARGQPLMHSITHDGWRSLYVGWQTPLSFNGPITALVLASNEYYKVAFQAALDLPSNSSQVLLYSGALAGATGSVFTTPANVIRMEQQIASRAVDGRQLLTASSVLANIWKSGSRPHTVLWNALPLEVACHSTGRMVYFTMYNRLKELGRYHHEVPAKGAGNGAPTPASTSISIQFRMLAAITASAAGWTITYPLDSIKCRLQTERRTWNYHESEGKELNHGRGNGRKPRLLGQIFACARSVAKVEGFRGFWRGYGVTIARSIVGSAITLPTFDYLSPLLRGAFGA